MPIKPENRARYPKDWKQVRARIQARAKDTCESCGVPNHAYRIRSGPRRDEWTHDPLQAESWAMEGEVTTYIVCTTAHLDHTPENCADANLLFLCQRCHLAHDRLHHAQTAARSRRQGKAIDMF